VRNAFDPAIEILVPAHLLRMLDHRGRKIRPARTGGDYLGGANLWGTDYQADECDSENKMLRPRNDIGFKRNFGKHFAAPVAVAKVTA
jgi:hypothetical protein